MAVKNTLTKRSSEIVYKANGVDVKLSPESVKRYLVSGGGDVSNEEIMMFLSLCKYQGLNPWIRDAYLIKYGKNSPAAMVVSKNVYMRRAQAQPTFRGYKAGVITITEGGELMKREGTFFKDDETLVGGWADVYIDGWNVPMTETVSLKEYMGYKSDGTPTAQWKQRPATMIAKVALVHALRSAYPSDLGQMYVQDERPELSEIVLDETPVEVPTTAPAPEPEAPAPDAAAALFGE